MAYHRKMERQESYLLSAQKTRPLLFGLPVMVQCAAEVTGTELYRGVWTQVARLVSPLPPASELALANHAQDWSVGRGCGDDCRCLGYGAFRDAGLMGGLLEDMGVERAMFTLVTV